MLSTLCAFRHRSHLKVAPLHLIDLFKTVSIYEYVNLKLNQRWLTKHVMLIKSSANMRKLNWKFVNSSVVLLIIIFNVNIKINMQDSFWPNWWNLIYRFIGTAWRRIIYNMPARSYEFVPKTDHHSLGCKFVISRPVRQALLCLKQYRGLQ